MNHHLVWRTTIPVIAVGVLLLSAGVYGAWRVQRLNQRSSDMVAENVTSIRAAKEFDTIAHRLRYRLKRFLITENERHLEEIATLIPAGHKWLDQTKRFAKTNREQQFITRLSRAYERLVEDFHRLTMSADEQRIEIAERMADESIPDDILASTQKYIELNESELAETNQRNQLSANRLMYGLLLLGTCGGVAGLLAGYGIARFLSRTIVQLSVPIRDAAGKLDEVVGPISISTTPGFGDLESILRTVSDRVSTVIERLQQSEREVLRGEQLAAVGQLAAGVAHELRNPLTAVKTILQLADSPEQLSARDLEVMQEEVARLEERVQALLDFARPTKQDNRLVNLSDLIDETVQLVARRAERQNVHLDCCLVEEPVVLVADATQLRQVVLNLLLNAFDAVCGGGSVRLETALEPQPARGNNGRFADVDCERDGWAVISICDGGAGLPASLGERIFDPFVSTKETGTGLGLSISKRIVEAHGGEIRAYNHLAGGAAFDVRLPLPGEIPPELLEAPEHQLNAI